MDKNSWDIEALSTELTRIRSVVGTEGESAISAHIYGRLAGLDYFQKKPDALKFLPVPEDKLGRKCIIAILEPHEASSECVLCIGHIDTVGVSDYASLQAEATDPHLLSKALAKMDLSYDAATDLRSGDYIFGRGIFDMKTGVAALMALFAGLSEKRELLESNLVLALLPDEEGASAGMLHAASVLQRLAAERGWKYIAAVDTDYMTGRGAEDEKKYVYIGSVGKLLPSFYVHGEQSHVGEAFSGLDANFISNFLMGRIDMNPKLCDVAEGEITQPPVSLRMVDLKEEYSVQTAEGAFLYFNYSTHSEGPDEVLWKLKAEAQEAFKDALAELGRRYDDFLLGSGLSISSLPWKPLVMTYSELIEAVQEDTGGLAGKIISSFEKGAGSRIDDPRKYSLELVREVHRHLSDQSPKIVVFFSPPYYPHIHVKGVDERERRLMEAVDSAVEEAKGKFGYDIAVRKFYPFISDLSYCRLPEEPGAIAALTSNMPAWGRKYELPLDAIAAISAPVVNIGPYGKDAHKMTERICRKYSHDAMPFILREVVLRLAGRSDGRGA